MNVWAVIPHYGPPEPTLELLDELRSATVAPARVVVVDNDGGLALDDDETVRVLRPGFNSGYGAAVASASDAALAAGADWLWVLNNDARPAADCLERLLEAGAAAPRAGILSAVIRYRTGGDVWYAGGTVSPRTLEVRHLHAVRDRSAYRTGFITGCAPLLRGALVRELSPMDDGLFMYYEDVDWSLRALDAGWELLVVPGAEVVHDVRREGGRRVFSDAAVYYMARNRLIVARRRGGLASAAAGGLAVPVAGRLPSPAAAGGLALPAAAGALWGLRQAAKSRSLPEARRRLSACGRGLIDGLAGRRGPARGAGGGGPS
ncbi:MAG: glycosyltransferase family 2 protein [Deltaproteobacteria bacterium]|nr:glycosyltransferase family 2 protein [Deltaproteobacteria bacterium]